MVGFALALAACAPQETAEKNMASVGTIPVDVNADEKADGSGLKVVREGAFKVGEKVTGEFTSRRGWIAYPIDLTGNAQVEITLGGLTDRATAQDTMFWVYGPKQANGQYPAQPFAFNDDEAQGVLSSKLYLTVPADGTYRILVSTWDNYNAYPDNVARGGYALRVTCASGGFGTCGAALSYEGEGCWADTDCRAEPDARQGAHCENEVTCPAGVQCIWVNEGNCRGDYVWLSLAPRQCASNPWQLQRNVTGDGVDGATPEGELTTIDRYFEDQGIDLLEVGFAGRPEPMATCSACSCPRGDLLVVKARAHQAAKLVSNHGFTRLADGAALQIAPKQCGTNPWDDETTAAGSPEEAHSIGAYTSSLGAPLHWVGHLYATEVRYQCRACSCARGDVVFVQPKDAAGFEALRQNGFGEIYVK
jgi:hypothetical protein